MAHDNTRGQQISRVVTHRLERVPQCVEAPAEHLTRVQHFANRPAHRSTARRRLLQLFVSFDPDAHYFTLYEDDPTCIAALRQLRAFDIVANNTDRKSGHCLMGNDGRIWAIDNGLCFHARVKLRTVIWEFGGDPVPEALLADVARIADGAFPRSTTSSIPTRSPRCARGLERWSPAGVPDRRPPGHRYPVAPGRDPTDRGPGRPRRG